MKHAPSILAIVVASFVIGCQDNGNILGTSGAGTSLQTQIAKRGHSEILELIELFHVPGRPNEFVEVNGSAECIIEIIPRDPIPPNPQFSISINMVVNANLRPWGAISPIWMFSGTSHNRVEPTNEGTAFLTTRYWVAGLNVWFVLTLRLTETSVAVDQMRLELPKIAREQDAN